MMFRQKYLCSPMIQKVPSTHCQTHKGGKNGCYSCQYPGVWTISGLGLDSNSVVGIGMA